MYGFARVAPFAGAWIEMPNDSFFRCQAYVAPFAGARIEISVLGSMMCGMLSLPSRSDGDSRTTILPPNLAPVPIPHNLSPTPTKTFAHVMTHVL